MLETLLESRPRNARSIGGTIASVTAHTALIAGAFYATVQARVQSRNSANMVRAVYFPLPTSPSTVPASHATTTKPVVGHALKFVDTQVSVDIKLSPIDMSNVVSRPGDFSPGPISGIRSGGDPKGGVFSPDMPLRADQVERQVAVVPGSPPPRYPETLRSSGVEGQVIAVFVVDEEGRAEEVSIRFLRSDNQLFEGAVRAALRRMRFIPAEVGGKKVRQLVQLPFVFTLAR